MPSRAVTTWRVGSAGGTRVAVSEATDKPVTPWSVAAFLPGSGVAQPGPTAFGKTSSRDGKLGFELAHLLQFTAALQPVVSLGFRKLSSSLKESAAAEFTGLAHAA